MSRLSQNLLRKLKNTGTNKNNNKMKKMKKLQIGGVARVINKVLSNTKRAGLNKDIGKYYKALEHEVTNLIGSKGKTSKLIPGKTPSLRKLNPKSMMRQKGGDLDVSKMKPLSNIGKMNVPSGPKQKLQRPSISPSKPSKKKKIPSQGELKPYLYK